MSSAPPVPHECSPGLERGLLLVLSGPSGSGKTTLIEELLKLREFPIDFSVSVTSRPPRPAEIEGVHYHFVSRSEFLKLRDGGELLEWAEVHGNLYGTPVKSVDRGLSQGRWILLEIDTTGHRQVKAVRPECISFFVRTTSLESYSQRLEQRGTETPESIARRIADATVQLSAAFEYDFQILNDDIHQALRTFRTLLWGLRALPAGASLDAR